MFRILQLPGSNSDYGSYKHSTDDRIITLCVPLLALVNFLFMDFSRIYNNIGGSHSSSSVIGIGIDMVMDNTKLSMPGASAGQGNKDETS
jgi:hypothetical protein